MGDARALPGGQGLTVLYQYRETAQLAEVRQFVKKVKLAQIRIVKTVPPAQPASTNHLLETDLACHARPTRTG